MQSDIRDKETKDRFIEYLQNNPEQRFFQAVRNFTLENLNKYSSFICSTSGDGSFEDTFNWECDKMLENKNEL
jgi:hypothetical protein